MKKITTIYVEGNVGAGKSTLLTFIKKHFDAQIVYEPHELWQNVDGHNLLEQFFKNQARWAFTLQTYITITRIEQLEKDLVHNHGRVQFVERSEYSGRYCFARNAYNMRLLTDLEWALYQKFWDREIKSIPTQPAGFIYLRIPAALCYQRIMKRNRFEEKSILLEYLTNLEVVHDEWLLHHKKVDHLEHIPVLLLDNVEDISTNEALQQEYVQKITEFIRKVQK